MIQFDCPSCSNEFEVEDSSAGVMGRCPKCKSVFRVPEISQNQFELLDNSYFSDPHLSQLYRDFLNEHESSVKNHRIYDEDGSEVGVVELWLDSGRTQVVYIIKSVIDNGETWVLLVSKVGIITQDTSAVLALQLLKLTSSITISLDDDNLLQASVFRQLSNFDQREFDKSMWELAGHADGLEKFLFDVDVE